MAHRYSVSRTIDAPIDLVFRRISDVQNFPDVSEDILGVEFLSETTQGVGTRFKETRSMKGRTTITELEITELVENEHVRFVSDAGGTIWDTVMKVTSNGDGTELDMTMDARPHKLGARVINLFIKGMVNTAVTEDMDKLKAWCEAQ